MAVGVHERLGEASNVLLLGTMLDDDTKELHNDLLSREGTDGRNVLALTFQSPSGWLQTWTADPATHDGDVVIMTFSETRSSSRSLPAGVSAITISPTDLTGIGITLSDYLSDFDDSDGGTLVCFDSVTELLQYTDPKSLFRFLRVVTRRIEHVDGFAHFHLDPSAHDDRIVATLRSPFDAIVEAGADSDVAVSTRY